MNHLSFYTDKLAISLSALCVMHCLASPLIVVFLPSVMAMQFESEAFHSWLLFAVIPTSIFSLLMGCKQHKQYRLLGIGLIGLLFLISATFVEDLAHGEHLEKMLTVLGACILALGHYSNFRLCRKQEECDCQSNK